MLVEQNCAAKDAENKVTVHGLQIVRDPTLVKQQSEASKDYVLGPNKKKYMVEFAATSLSPTIKKEFRRVKLL